MIQNLRVDTIYYLTNSDFEMEFNLCGCCKMRLLTDKAENPKNFIGLLSRAVSRSQIIICCGKLFGEDGLINVVSQSIRKPLTTIDNSAYDIADANEIKIIGGSVPLVNSDGCFCGCIIESGPQSIILLTDNKSIRKTVMKPLIHPYIEELSIIRNGEKNGADETAEESVVNETEISEEVAVQTESTETVDENQLDSASEESDLESETIENTEFAPSLEISDVPFEETDNNDNTNEESTQNDNSISDDSDSSDDDDSYKIPSFVAPNRINDGFDLYLVPERQEKKNKHPETDFMPSNNNSFSSSREYDSNIQKKDKKINISILIMTIILLCALAALAYLLVFVPMKSNYVFSEYIKNIFSVSVNIRPLI